MAYTKAHQFACMNLNPHAAFRTGPDGRQQLPQPIRQECKRAHLSSVAAGTIFEGFYEHYRLLNL